MINVRDVIVFMKQPGVKSVLWIFAICIFGLIFAYYYNNFCKPAPKKGAMRSDEIFADNSRKTGIAYDMINKDSETAAPVPPAVPAPTTPVKKDAAPVTRPQKTVVEAPPIINIFSRPPQKDEYELGDRFAPYGRLMECQLVITVDSAMAETPVVGLVTHNLWHAGKLIIPAGAEVHGRAVAKPIRDRVMTDKNWVVVWRSKDDDNGKELRISGYALTKEAMLTDNSWHMHDGSAGIRGEVIKSSQMTEIMAYAAEFMATFTDNLTQQSVTITDWGQTTTTSGTTKDAINQGIAAATRKYADKLMDQIKTEGYFVRCAGGTPFYLYITDVVNMSEADLAGTKLSTIKK